jgi:hypothetical protein
MRRPRSCPWTVSRRPPPFQKRAVCMTWHRSAWGCHCMADGIVSQEPISGSPFHFHRSPQQLLRSPHWTPASRPAVMMARGGFFPPFHTWAWPLDACYVVLVAQRSKAARPTGNHSAASPRQAAPRPLESRRRPGLGPFRLGLTNVGTRPREPAGPSTHGFGLPLRCGS